MSTAAAPPPPSSQVPRLTAADLEALPNEKDYELVDGQLIEDRKIGFDSSRVGAKVIVLLSVYCELRKLGVILGMDFGYQCFPDDSEKVRRPDVSFIAAERLGGMNKSRGYSNIAPDLAVEVISPNDLFSDVSKKVEEYLAAGVRLVWVFDPEARSALIYRRSGGGAILGPADELSGEDVIPGFRCQLSEVFAPPPGVA